MATSETYNGQGEDSVRCPVDGVLLFSERLRRAAHKVVKLSKPNIEATMELRRLARQHPFPSWQAQTLLENIEALGLSGIGRGSHRAALQDNKETMQQRRVLAETYPGLLSGSIQNPSETPGYYAFRSLLNIGALNAVKLTFGNEQTQHDLNPDATRSAHIIGTQMLRHSGGGIVNKIDRVIHY